MGTLEEQYGRWALIAGADGVGEEVANILAADGVSIFLVARRPEPLNAVAERLRNRHGVEVRTLSLDLTSPTMLEEISAATESLEVGMLVFNAGVDARVADFHDRSYGNIRRVIDLNVIGQTLLARHFGELMRRRKRGGIIMVGALLSFSGGGGMSVYAASKAYIYTLAQGLWHELKPHNVNVLGLIVGATYTPAYQRIGIPRKIGGIVASDPAEVAREAIDVLGKEPIWIPKDQQALAERIRSLSPAEAVMEISSNAGEMHESY